MNIKSDILKNTEKFRVSLGVEHYQNKHFMPNEIFDDLKNSKLKPVHVVFGYCYYYLTSWLFRHGKYREFSFSNKRFKEILGYNPSNKTLDYIIKENGVLDTIGYTKTTKNFPVGLRGLYSDNTPEFLFVSDLSKIERGELYRKINRNFKVKYPIKHMHRYDDDMEENMFTGVYYDPSNTHCVDFDIFSYSMNNPSIGVMGFYIYCFLRYKCQLFQDTYQVSYNNLSAETGIPYSTLAKYLDNLRGYNMIIGIQNQEYYVDGLTDEERESNYYMVNNFNSFNHIRKKYTKINGISMEQYKKLAKENNTREG